MPCLQNAGRAPLFVLVTIVAACQSGPDLAAPAGAAGPAPLNMASAVAIAIVDLSNGSGLEGTGRVISSTGVILGGLYLNGRGWWQSPSPAYTKIDDGVVQNGNRQCDAGGGQNTVLLSTSCGAPWTTVTLVRPVGVSGVLARDMNDSRIIVGNTLGSEIYALRWDSPQAAPTRLPLPALQYPVLQVTANAISNSGLIAGYVYEQTGKNRARYEAILWSAGTAQVLPLAAGAISQRATNVNDAGVVSGYIDTNTSSYPARWTPNSSGQYTVTVLSLSSSKYNLYTGIDACGRVSGGSDQGAFVWDGVSAATILPNLDGSQSAGVAYDLNEAGNIVGSSAAGTQKGRVIQRPTLWTGLTPCTP